SNARRGGRGIEVGDALLHVVLEQAEVFADQPVERQVIGRENGRAHFNETNARANHRGRWPRFRTGRGGPAGGLGQFTGRGVTPELDIAIEALRARQFGRRLLLGQRRDRNRRDPKDGYRCRANTPRSHRQTVCQRRGGESGYSRSKSRKGFSTGWSL